MIIKESCFSFMDLRIMLKDRLTWENHFQIWAMIFILWIQEGMAKAKDRPPL